jgi:hypothetical protein
VAPLDGNSPITHINGKQCRVVTTAYTKSIKNNGSISAYKIAATSQQIKPNDIHPPTLANISTLILTICCM